MATTHEPGPWAPSDAFSRAVDILAHASRVFVFTGSGMSAESGIPTFRGPQGLWQGMRPEDVASLEAFERDPAFVWKWYRQRILAHRTARPHAGHRALAKLQHHFGRCTIATQNVDLLHEEAGARGVLHLHGRLDRVRCQGCSLRQALGPVHMDEAVPACPECGGLQRPDIVWFGEPLPKTTFEEASVAAQEAEAAIVVGTSNLVYPAASLPQLALAQGARIVEVNPDPTPLTPHVESYVAGSARDVLPALRRAIQETKN